MQSSVMYQLSEAADRLLEERGPLYRMSEEEMETKLKEIERKKEDETDGMV